MHLKVIRTDDGPRLSGEGAEEDVEAVNRFLTHLGARAFSPATVRAYAFDLLNFLRFCATHELVLSGVVAVDLFDYLDWQARPVKGNHERVVRLGQRRGAAPATMNRRIAAVRGLFEHQSMIGIRSDSPVPTARRSSGLRAPRRGLLGHLGPGRARGSGQLVRSPRRLPEAIDPADVSAFLTDLSTFRDRAIVLAMVLGGLRSAEVRSLRLADVDFGLRRLRVMGKGGKERVIPIDSAPAGLPHTPMLRRPAWTHHWWAVDRGRVTKPVPNPQCEFGCHPGPSAPAQAYLRNRTRLSRN